MISVRSILPPCWTMEVFQFVSPQLPVVVTPSSGIFLLGSEFSNDQTWTMWTWTCAPLVLARQTPPVRSTSTPPGSCFLDMNLFGKRFFEFVQELDLATNMSL